MLTNVHLRNLALIKEADIEFGKGLNILTGETGAGKSIILGSINIALGDKASKSFIRSGAPFGLVELSFQSGDARIQNALKELEIETEEDTLLISRRITAESSTSRVNNTAVTLANLREITSLLVDIHGQHDHQSLLNPARHLDIVDEYGAEQILPVKEALHSAYGEFKSLRSRYRTFSQDPAELAKEKEFLEFEIREIEQAQLKEGEDTALEEEFQRLSNAGKVHEGIQKIRTMLFDAADSATSRLSDALKELGFLLTMDPELKSCMDALMDLDSISRDLNHDLSHYAQEHQFSEERYRMIHERLDEINRLKSKYGKTIADILAYQDKLSDRVQEMETYESQKAQLTMQMEEAAGRVKEYASQLSGIRQEAAAGLEKRIRANLEDLNFLNVEFCIRFGKADKIYENGFDKVEFLISTNVGEEMKPLVKVASGGELSRVMLAIKASIAQADHTDTLIFDEIDAGISGRTAQKVAEKLAVLSKDHQIICITHLPQIAAMADHHFAIEKSVSDGSTISGIRKLSRPDSILELARLLSGSEITEHTIQSAEEMKEAAAKFR